MAIPTCISCGGIPIGGPMHFINLQGFDASGKPVGDSSRLCVCHSCWPEVEQATIEENYSKLPNGELKDFLTGKKETLESGEYVLGDRQEG